MSAATLDGSDPVVTAVEDRVGRILLNRPGALNALTLDMVQHITAALEEWRDKPLRAVLIESISPKAFCAGGDIRAVRQNTLEGHPERSEAFFSAEYAMNGMLAAYDHPIVSLIDGVCMGGGLGLSVHGRFRVVTERAVLAMPETAIGFFPDIGASYFLPRLPGAVGMYLALTGARVGAADAVACGLATHHVASDRLPELTAALMNGAEAIEDVLARCALNGGIASEVPGPIAAARPEIDRSFGADSVTAIRDRLRASGTEWARDQLATLDRMSPSSLEVTYDLLSHGRDRTLSDCLEAELEASRVVTRSHDFVEGVRAVLVDKDHDPQWE